MCSEAHILLTRLLTLLHICGAPRNCLHLRAGAVSPMADARSASWLHVMSQTALQCITRARGMSRAACADKRLAIGDSVAFHDFFNTLHIFESTP